LRAYRPRRYEGKLLLVVAQQTQPLFREQFFGWEHLASELEIEIRPGGHYDLINEPGVGALVEILRRRLA